MMSQKVYKVDTGSIDIPDHVVKEIRKDLIKEMKEQVRAQKESPNFAGDHQFWILYGFTAKQLDLVERMLYSWEEE